MHRTALTGKISVMGHLDVSRVSYALPDGTPLLDEVSFRVPAGGVVALVGANGAGKSTLLRLIAGELPMQTGAVTTSGTIGVMPQFIGSVRDESVVRDLLLATAPQRVRDAAAAVDACELALMEAEDEPLQMKYAQALADWADAGGYDIEVLWDTVTVAALHDSYDRTKWRDVSSLSGGEQKRLVLEALLRGPDNVLLLDEPDNYLDVPGKTWLEDALRESTKTVLFISHDRELLARAATAVVTVELGAAGNTAWTHPGGFATYHDARAARFERLDELRRRWDEEHAKLKALVLMYKTKAAFNDGLASRYQAAQTRLKKFEDAGPPQATARKQRVTMRLTGGRTGKRAVVCKDLELTGLMRPFDAEIWFGERVAVLGANGSGKSHFLRLLAAAAPIRNANTYPSAISLQTPSLTPARRDSVLGSVLAGSRRHTNSRCCSDAHCSTSFITATNTATAWGAKRPAACSTDMSSPVPPSRPSRPCPADSRPGCRFCCSNYPVPQCFFSMSRRTTSTSRVRKHSRQAWRHSREAS